MPEKREPGIKKGTDSATHVSGHTSLRVATLFWVQRKDARAGKAVLEVIFASDQSLRDLSGVHVLAESTRRSLTWRKAQEFPGNSSGSFILNIRELVTPIFRFLEQTYERVAGGNDRRIP